MSTVEVKICGLTRRQDAEAAVRSGASYLGAVFAAESPRAVSPERAAALFDGLVARRVGVFVNAMTPEIVAAASTVRLDVIQLHGEEEPEQLRELRGFGAWRLWKAARICDAAGFRSVVDRYSSLVDGVLLDGWDPARRGGTGRPFEWGEIALLRDLLPPHVRLIVAGGLRAENVGRAVALLRPHTVDISSGVESAPGIKDPAAIQAVMNALEVPSR